MCGRYASSRSPEDLVEMFEVDQLDLPDVRPEPSFNVAPTTVNPVVLERLPDPAPAADQEPDADTAEPAADTAEPAADTTVRQLRYLTWGLVPSWSRDASGGARMINARAESLLEKPAFRRAAVARRCLVPADGWFEWQRSPTATVGGKPRKHPFFLRSVGDEPLAFAGLYEFWRDASVHGDDPQAWLVTYAIITTVAEPGLAAVHDRMPLALPPSAWRQWLDPRERDPDGVRALLQPGPPGRFEPVPVTTRVNHVRNNGPQLLTPAAPEDLHGVLDPATGEMYGGDAAALF